MRVIPRIPGIVLGAIATCGLTLPCAAFAQAAAQSSAAVVHAPAFVRWRHSMLKTHLPGKGCFTASYPDKEWHEVRCVTAPPRPPTPPPTPGHLPQAGATMAVGNGSDFTAQVASGTTISRGEGAFIQAVNVNSENAGGVANEFSLQLNANFFTTAACNAVAGCQGWAQFVYANPYQTTSGPASYAAAFIQYWLLNYGSACPSGWNQSQTSCWYNSPIVEVPLQTIASLRSMTLAGTSGSAGNDTVAFSVDGTLYGASNGTSDPNVGLAGHWTTAEFNVFGDGGLSAATFNTGASLAVTTTVNNGTSSSPSCTQGGTTGETNSFTLVTPCCPFAGTGGSAPGIAFLESSASPVPTANCSALTHPYVWWLAAVDQLLLPQ